MLVQGDSLRSLLALLIPCFANPRREDKEERVISLGLYIVRNLLAIKDVVAEDTATGEKEELSTLQVRCRRYLALTVVCSHSATEQTHLPRALPHPWIRASVRPIQHDSAGHCASHVPVCQDGGPGNGSEKSKVDIVLSNHQAAMENLTKLLELERREKTRTLKGRSNVTRHSRFGTTIAVRAANQGVSSRYEYADLAAHAEDCPPFSERHHRRPRKAARPGEEGKSWDKENCGESAPKSCVTD